MFFYFIAIACMFDCVAKQVIFQEQTFDVADHYLTQGKCP
jgi:ribosomal protein S27E